jgi:RNA recognition motif-containing protein
LSNVRVYVANIPYILTPSEFQAAFTEKGYQVKEVSVGTRAFNPALNVGYGFVEFVSSEEQERVLREIPHFNIKGRDCTILPARPIPEKFTNTAGSK